MQKILGRSRESNEKKNSYDKKREEPRRRFKFSRRDPNAMDVDMLTIEKRDEMMKKGLCFWCEKPGHLSRDCPNKKLGTTYSPPMKRWRPKNYIPISDRLQHWWTTRKEKSFTEKPKKRVFKLETCIDVRLSNHRCFLCTLSHHSIKFIIDSSLNNVDEEHCALLTRTRFLRLSNV